MIESLGQSLKTRIVDVKFTKADGTVRDMRCSQLPDYFVKSETEVQSDKTKRTASDDVWVVYDIDKQSVRSFRRDSVISFS
jgi:hypothetical protein